MAGFCKHRVMDKCKKDGKICIFSKDCFEPEEVIAPTNADRIRAMSDEELAEQLAPFQCEGWNRCCEAFGIEGHRVDGHGDNPDILDYLRQPAEEGK